MIITLIAGLWALISGKISVAPKLSLKNKYARFYGLTLFILAIPVAWIFGYLTPFVCFHFHIVKTSKTIVTLIDLVYQINILLVLAYSFKKWQDKS